LPGFDPEAPYKTVWFRNVKIRALIPPRLPEYGGLGLKNEGRPGPFNRVLFFPVVYLFEGKFTLKRVVIEVVFPGVGKT
jgi:hypothetical protein